MTGTAKVPNAPFHNVKYNCLIAEDDPIQRGIIALYREKMDGFKVSAICSSGTEAAIVLGRETIDIVFSDIDMPGLSGPGLLKTLISPPVFIFITAHSDYAVESFALDVVDYVVKPVSFERFYRAANKAAEYIELRKSRKPGNTVPLRAENLMMGETNSQFFIPAANGISRLRYSDVLYIESMGDSSRIHTLCGESQVTLINLKNLTAQLPEAIFKRIHRQFTVNMDHIVNISGGLVHLQTGRTLPNGESYRKELLELVVNQKVFGRYPK